MIIWGTGNICKRIMESYPELMPDFFIDNNIDKADEVAYGKRIMHPSHIQDWNQLYVLVAVDNYMPIKKQLEEKGLKETLNFIWYRDFFFESTLPQIWEEAEEFLTFLKEKASLYCGKSVIFADFLSFDKGICDFVNSWQTRGLDAVLLSEAYWVEDKYAEERMNIPVCKLPAILARNQYLKKEIVVDNYIIDCVEKSCFLKEASVNLRMGYPKMSVGYEYVVCYWADRIVRAIIEMWQPKEVILWNAFYAFHTIIRKICEEKNVFVKYMEFGNIPGMIQVEALGQMGESYPARFPEEFLRLAVSAKEYQEAEELIEQLCRSRINRNTQPQNQLLNDVKEQLVKDRPIVLYAGQNDNAAGLQPYTDNSKKYHSPIFRSSDDAAIYLAGVCKRNNWNYIYKPHPMMIESFVIERIPQGTIIVNDVDINDLIDMSDVVVTILSTVSYIGLIRKKPVLMLGYTQLKEKGCTYEAYELEKIEIQLQEAICHSQTNNMKKAFKKHIIQMNKYYAKEKGGIPNEQL